MKTNKFLACLGLSVACFMAASSAYAAVAGHVQFVNGEVQITNPAGQTRMAQKGDAINEGDTLTSAQKASAQIKMQDGGFVAVRPDTQLKFDQFVFAGKEDGSEKSFFSLFKGGFRAVTGLIGRINKQNYRITTPAATIGIRGTDHETFIITPGSPLAQIAPTGAYNKVNTGETSMTTDKGTIFVQPNQMGFAGGMNQMPQVQPINTKVFTVAEAATPEAKAEKKEKKEEKTEAKQEEKAANGDKEEG
ncbi:MAG: FecR domain-containing protein, partial [Gallionella sp.]|nr:FecR domain-containing protein [Gallionella sp.]